VRELFTELAMITPSEKSRAVAEVIVEAWDEVVQAPEACRWISFLSQSTIRSTRVLIGPAGIGKSTCVKIAHDWASDRLFKMNLKLSTGSLCVYSTPQLLQEDFFTDFFQTNSSLAQ